MGLFVGIGDAPATTGEQSLFAGCRNAKIFFVASAAASSAYLTVSEIFALEIRSLAIAILYSAPSPLGSSHRLFSVSWSGQAGGTHSLEVFFGRSPNDHSRRYRRNRRKR